MALSTATTDQSPNSQSQSILSASETCNAIAIDIKALSKQLLKVEKEFGPVRTALGKLKVREAATPNPDAAANSIAKVLQRVKDVRIRTQDQLAQLDSLLFAHEGASKGRIALEGEGNSGNTATSRRLRPTMFTSDGGRNDDTNSIDERMSLAYTRRDIVEYLACRGHDDLALKLAHHYQIPLSLVPSLKQDHEQEEELRVLLADLDCCLPPLEEKGTRGVDQCSRRNLTRCIAWAEENKGILSKENGNLLLVMLRTQELLQMCLESSSTTREKESPAAGGGEERDNNSPSPHRKSGGNGVELLSFVATHLLPHAPAHPTRVQDAATCATHLPSENFKGMYDEIHWQNLVEQLKKDVATVRRMKKKKASQELHGGENTTTNQPFPALARHCLCAALSARDLVPSEEELLEAASRTERLGLEHPKVPHTTQLLRKLQSAVDPSAANRLVFRRGTQLFCCVTGKSMVNPRVLTTTGTIVSEEGYKLLIAAAAKEQSEEQARQGPPAHIVCPLTGAKVQVRNVKKMFVV